VAGSAGRRARERLVTTVVVGGGIVGAAVAATLAERGHAVHVIEQSDPGGAVSGASLACLGTHMIDVDELPALQWACEAWAAFAEATGNAFEYRVCGQIRFLERERERAIALRWIARECAAGLRPELLEPAAIRAIEPALDGPILAATWSPGDAVVNPFLAVRAYVNRARAAGAMISSGTRVTAIETTRDRVVAVRAGSERIACDVAVIAAGPWTAPLARTAGVDVPIVPRKAQCLVTERVAPAIRTVVGACRDDGGVDAGYTQIQQAQSGAILFNTVLGANASPAGSYDAIPEIDRVFLRDSVATLLRLFPRFADIALLRSWVRYEAVTPDDRFLIGRSGPDGLLLAAGDGGTGFVRAPAIGRIIADLLDGTPAPFRTDLYDPLRFAPDRAIA
jgi:sarcosine oxidase subunit beta